MNLIGISINHHTAPVELREALFLSDEEIRNFIQNTKGKVFSESLVISTCNRTEIYGIPINQSTTHLEIQNLLLIQKPNSRVTQENFKSFFSESAITHLFRVISGIDSMLIGDNQIYNQVKDSFQLAEEMSSAGFLMKRLFDSAVKTGKRAITETEIFQGAVTVSYSAIQLIEKIFSNLSKKSALIIGAGETAEIAAKHLRDKGIGKLSLTNRTFEKAEKLSSNLNAMVLAFPNFKENLHNFDIIISATSSPDHILTYNDIEATMEKRNYNPIVLMDIAIPRNIDPQVKELEYVFYNDIDSLNIIVGQNLAKRKDEIPKVEGIIKEEVSNFLAWFNSLEVAPTIKNLRDFFEEIRAEEVSKNKNKFSSDDQEKLEIVTKRIVNKILHQPTLELKKINEKSSNSEEAAIKLGIIRDFFGIDKKNNGENSDEI
ncbi:MAG: glutamyl-tRNA reductase, partial [Ignavibacteriaceae bacterium]